MHILSRMNIIENEPDGEGWRGEKLSGADPLIPPQGCSLKKHTSRYILVTIYIHFFPMNSLRHGGHIFN